MINIIYNNLYKLYKKMKYFNKVKKIIFKKLKGQQKYNPVANGKKFELQTLNEKYLLANKFKKIVINKNKYGYYLQKRITNKEIIFTTQHGFRYYVEKTFNVISPRLPDEAYIINYYNNQNKIVKTHIKILEKKEQICNGSCIDKLYSGDGIKYDYQTMFSAKKFKISYAFCLNKFLWNKYCNIRYKSLHNYCKKKQIKVFNGSNKIYFKQINQWMNQV